MIFYFRIRPSAFINYISKRPRRLSTPFKEQEFMDPLQSRIDPQGVTSAPWRPLETLGDPWAFLSSCPRPSKETRLPHAAFASRSVAQRSLKRRLLIKIQANVRMYFCIYMCVCAFTHTHTHMHIPSATCCRVETLDFNLPLNFYQTFDRK